MTDFSQRRVSWPLPPDIPAPRASESAEEWRYLFYGFALGLAASTIIWPAIYVLGSKAYQAFSEHRIELRVMGISFGRAPMLIKPAVIPDCGQIDKPYRRSLRHPAICARRA